jgi:hypothetical protein
MSNEVVKLEERPRSGCKTHPEDKIIPVMELVFHRNPRGARHRNIEVTRHSGLGRS